MTNNEYHTFAQVCDYLDAVLSDAIPLGLPQYLVIDIRLALTEARALLDEYDPTPWCSSCGAMREIDCHCGPLADND